MKKPSPDSCCWYTTAKYILHMLKRRTRRSRERLRMCVSISIVGFLIDNHVFHWWDGKKKMVIKRPLKYYIKKYRVAHTHTQDRGGENNKGRWAEVGKRKRVSNVLLVPACKRVDCSFRLPRSSSCQFLSLSLPHLHWLLLYFCFVFVSPNYTPWVAGGTCGPPREELAAVIKTKTCGPPPPFGLLSCCWSWWLNKQSPASRL